MKKSWIYIVIGMIVFAIVGLMIKAKQWWNNIDYGVAKGVKLLGLTGKNISVLLPVWIYNPSPFKIILSDLDLDVYFNNYKVSKIQSRSNYELSARSYSTYPLTIQARPMDILNLLADQGTIIDQPDWLKKVNVRVVGTVTLYAGIFTIRDFKIDFTDSLKYYVG